jgi:hypothetical protein
METPFQRTSNPLWACGSGCQDYPPDRKGQRVESAGGGREGLTDPVEVSAGRTKTSDLCVVRAFAVESVADRNVGLEAAPVSPSSELPVSKSPLVIRFALLIELCPAEQAHQCDAVKRMFSRCHFVSPYCCFELSNLSGAIYAAGNKPSKAQLSRGSVEPPSGRSPTLY